MIALRAEQVVSWTGGRLVAGDPATAVAGPVVVDSRLAREGSLFVALPGERVDGAAHAAAAVAAGAVAVLVPEASLSAVDVPAGTVVVAVPDGVEALGELASHVLTELTDASGGTRPLVVGVTGSQGKTTTKDLLAHVLAPLGPVVAPAGNFNNEIGAPLTVLRADRDTAALVVEMGARGPGHIADLARMARPRTGVVLTVGSAHASEFGSLDATARAKGELVEALPVEGTAVLNADDSRVAAMATRTFARVLTFGRSTDAAVRAVDVDLDELARPRFTLVHAGESAPVALRLHGEHHVTNALAAAAVALEAGADVGSVAASLSAATPASRWRMEVTERPDGVTVVNDAYNANPDSMRAGLRGLAALAAGRRTWAVLGPMGELGEAVGAAYAEVAGTARGCGVAELVAVGCPDYRAAFPAARDVPDVDGAVALLRERLRPGDVVFVKGSRAAGLERVAAGVLAATTAEEVASR